ncbi:MAG: exodeoxyribonuclease VII large subunit [Myxococcota bacterium]
MSERRPHKRRRPRRTVRLLESDGRLAVRFEYNDELIDAIKELPGKQWDPKGRRWLVAARHAAEVMDIVHDREFVVDDEVRKLAARGGHNARMRQLRRATRRDSLTPVTLNRAIRESLRQTFPERIWIIGEVSDWKDRGFFSLIERREEEAEPRAVSPAFVREDVFRNFRRVLSEMKPPLQWQNGLVVRLEVRPEFWARSGMTRLQVVDIDPFYTIILLNAEREAALRVLDEEGISEKNIDRALSPVPLRLALLTSAQSEAAHDFIDELRRSGFGFQVDLYDVRVQGDRLAPTVLAALGQVALRHRDYDATVIIRGGGSRTDLAGFDRLSIGRAVCLHPLPVLVGIGHQRDHALLDDVARSYKTPTAVGAALSEMVGAFRREVEEIEGQIGQIAAREVHAHRQTFDALVRAFAREAGHRLGTTRRSVEDVRLDIVRSLSGRLRREKQQLDGIAGELPIRWRRRARREAREIAYLEGALSPQRRLRALQTEKARLMDQTDRLSRAVSRRLERARDGLAVLEARRRAADPEAIFARGFATVRAGDGTLVRDATAVESGEVLQVRLQRGSVSVTPAADPAGENDE